MVGLKIARAFQFQLTRLGNHMAVLGNFETAANTLRAARRVVFSTGAGISLRLETAKAFRQWRNRNTADA
jgi:hypothetical protein